MIIVLYSVFRYTYVNLHMHTQTGQRSGTEAMASTSRVHRFLCDMAAHDRSHVHVFHLGGLLPETLYRTLQSASDWSVPHVRCCGHTGLVGRLAARVHEVTGTGTAWRRDKDVAVAEAEGCGQRKGRGAGVVSGLVARNTTQLRGQWVQHDSDAIRTETSL